LLNFRMNYPSNTRKTKRAWSKNNKLTMFPGSCVSFCRAKAPNSADKPIYGPGNIFVCAIELQIGCNSGKRNVTACRTISCHCSPDCAWLSAGAEAPHSADKRIYGPGDIFPCAIELQIGFNSAKLNSMTWKTISCQCSLGSACPAAGAPASDSADNPYMGLGIFSSALLS
jgi:hypothetical protein